MSNTSFTIWQCVILNVKSNFNLNTLEVLTQSVELSDGPLGVIARQCFLRFTFAATIHLGDFELLFYVDIMWLLTVKTNRGIDIFVGLWTLDQW